MPERAPGLAAWLARRRVALGFITAIVVIVFSAPTWGSWTAGLLVAVIGESLRVWAAGHLEKSREVTRSGPYQWLRHPLYVGSSVIALGVAIASSSVMVALVGAIYMTSTITAAIRTEEAFLRQAFGDTYERYQRSDATPMHRRFSLERALRNREYRAVLGLAAGFGLLALKAVLPI